MEPLTTQMSVPEYWEGLQRTIDEVIAGVVINSQARVEVGGREVLLTDADYPLASVNLGSPGRYHYLNVLMTDAKVACSITCGRTGELMTGDLIET